MEGRKLLNTVTRLGYHFEVPLIDLISFLIDEKRKKACSLINIGHSIAGKVDKVKKNDDPKWNLKKFPATHIFFSLSLYSNNYQQIYMKS